MNLSKKPVFVWETLEYYDSVTECAKALGVSKQTLSMYLNGHYKFSLKVKDKYTVMYAEIAYDKLNKLGFFNEE